MYDKGVAFLKGELFSCSYELKQSFLVKMSAFVYI